MGQQVKKSMSLASWMPLSLDRIPHLSLPARPQTIQNPSSKTNSPRTIIPRTTRIACWVSIPLSISMMRRTFSYNYKSWNNDTKNRSYTKYVTIPDDYRFSIDRDCLSFKRAYTLRYECKRYTSRFKNYGQERLWVYNGIGASNLNIFSRIVSQLERIVKILLP